MGRGQGDEEEDGREENEKRSVDGGKRGNSTGQKRLLGAVSRH